MGKIIIMVSQKHTDSDVKMLLSKFKVRVATAKSLSDVDQNDWSPLPFFWVLLTSCSLKQTAVADLYRDTKKMTAICHALSQEHGTLVY